MTTHEIPEWETPSTHTNTKPSFLHKPALFTAHNPSNTLPSKPEVESHVSQNSLDLVSPPPAKRTLSDRFTLRKRKIWVGITVVIVILLVVIIGLVVGLRKHKSKPQNLPLPTNNGIFTGDLTYYSPGPGYGACGYENTSSDSICAVSHLIWDASSTSSNPNNNPLCGRKIRITRFDSTVGGNRSVDVEVVDRCVGCKATDLDLSLSVFDKLAEEAEGRVTGSWAWLT